MDLQLIFLKSCNKPLIFTIAKLFILGYDNDKRLQKGDLRMNQYDALFRGIWL